MKSIQKIASFLTFVIFQAKVDLEICDSIITLNKQSSQFDVKTDFGATYNDEHEINDSQLKNVAELDFASKINSSSKKNFIRNHLHDNESQIVSKSNFFLNLILNSKSSSI